MPRLFTGIEIPRGIGDHLMLLRGDIPAARWVEPDNYHITLRFLGDVSNAVADEFAARIADPGLPPFEVALQGTGSFGSRHPHSLWVGVRPNDSLSALVRQHERAALAVGLAPETRPFTPHVTIARLGRCRAAELAPFLDAFAAFRAAPFVATRVVLYSSRPSQGGGPYALEAAFPLNADLAGDDPDQA